MKYTQTTPCKDCPFRKEGGVRLTRERAEEIGSMMLSSQGGTFACHKTTIACEGPDGEGDRAVTAESLHCAGALVFAEKNGNATQMMRIMERIGMYDHTKLKGQDEVFDDLDQMVEAQDIELATFLKRRAKQPKKSIAIPASKTKRKTK